MTAFPVADERQASTAITLVRAVLAGVALAGLAGALWLLWWVLVAAVVPGWTPVAITSGSMAPHIRPGDVVVAGAAGPDLLTEGAVIVFRDDHYGLVTHRIAGVELDGDLRTKGDANADEDSGRVATADVVGRGRLLIPVVGRPLVWVHDGRWGNVVGLLAAVAVAWLFVLSWWRSTAATPALDPSARTPTRREQELIAFAWVER